MLRHAEALYIYLPAYGRTIGEYSYIVKSAPYPPSPEVIYHPTATPQNNLPSSEETSPEKKSVSFGTEVDEQI